MMGAFSVGLIEGATNAVIDGNETGYAYRSQAEFDVAYSWRKSGIVIDGTTAYIPSSMNATWSSKISCAEPTYNLTLNYSDGPRVMSTAIMPGVLNMALRGVDEYVWFYWEENRNGNNSDRCDVWRDAGVVGRRQYGVARETSREHTRPRPSGKRPDRASRGQRSILTARITFSSCTRQVARQKSRHPP